MQNNKRYCYIKSNCFLIVFLTIHYVNVAQVNDLIVHKTGTASSFPVVSTKGIASFYYDKSDAEVVRIAAEAFKSDVASITGKEIKLVTDRAGMIDYTIVAGTIGHSALLDELITSGNVDVSGIKDQWERFSIHITGQADKRILVIAGSDRRGTAYGIFHLSRTMGASPFIWWADVVPPKRKEVFVSGSYTSASPSVKYRGIFINDEDWGLQPWAAKNIDTDIKDIGPKTYAKVFELMLRLKANYIWPAMHPCTKAFYYYKDNPKVADDYAIIVGGSHCEPMLRNNVFEWTENFEHEYGKKPGEWRYDVNKDEIYKYWDDRVKEAVNYESVYTVGMRGIHDGSMPGPRDPNEKLKLLENVINDQRKILGLNFRKPVREVPQIFVPYKEVLSLYRRGLNLDDDVTIIWPDDNHGNIRQLPNETERKRSGGHGVYYHLSYWGSPHDYLWLSSISPSLISYEMTKAYNYGADRLWVFNVGDIKPAELELQFAMDLAWDISKWTPERAYSYTRQWAKEIFGDAVGEEVTDVISLLKNEYYHLAASGKPEHMNLIELSYSQARERVSQYQSLSILIENVKKKIPLHLQDAYYELLYYPVQAATLMNYKILRAKLSFHSDPNNKSSSLTDSKESWEAFAGIQAITNRYNQDIASGKWNGIMSWHPRDLPVFQMPITADSASQLVKDSLAKKYFNTADPELIYAASGFIRKKETSTSSIRVIKGLGVNGTGVTTNQSKDVSYTDAAYIEFDLSIPPALAPGVYNIIIKCLPAFDVNHSKHLRYSIAVNNETPQTVNVHAEADSKEWKENVIRGYSAGKTTHTITRKGMLRIWFNDPGLVINTIEFYKLTNSIIK
jgi:hypothetical protein